VFEAITWVLFRRAKRREKVEAALAQYAEALGAELSVAAFAPYPKGPPSWRVVFTMPLGESDPARAVFRTLLACQRLGHEWTIHGPNEAGSGRWWLHGWTMNQAVGVDLLLVDIRNFGDWSGEDGIAPREPSSDD
jgi:hypothetical protein